MQFGQQQGADVVVGGQVDEDGGGLPGLRAEFNAGDEGLELRQEGLLLVKVHGQFDDLFERVVRQVFNGGAMFGGERVGEVEQDHFSNSDTDNALVANILLCIFDREGDKFRIGA